HCARVRYRGGSGDGCDARRRERCALAGTIVPLGCDAMSISEARSDPGSERRSLLDWAGAALMLAAFWTTLRDVFWIPLGAYDEGILLAHTRLVLAGA